MPHPNSQKIIYALLIITLLISIGGIVFSQMQISQLKEEVFVLTNSPYNQYVPPTPYELPVNETPSPTSTAIAGTPTPKPTPSPQAVIQFPKTLYIPLGGESNTQTTDWVDVPNSVAWLDFGSEFGPYAKAVFEGILRVDNANGTAYARLVDATHGIAVNGSEIKLENNSQFNLSVSGNLTFWAGKNLYKVQIKSLNGSTVFLDSARLKISY